MDPNPAVSFPATEDASSQRSGLPSLTPPFVRAPPSYDSDTETAPEFDAGTSTRSSSVRSNASDAGFDTASEMPFVGDQDDETFSKAAEEAEDVDVTFLEPSGSPEFFPVPNPSMPIAKVSLEDDDDVDDNEDEDEDTETSPKAKAPREDLVVRESPVIQELNSGLGSVEHLESEDRESKEHAFSGETNPRKEAVSGEGDVANAATSTEEASAKILGHGDGGKEYGSPKLDNGVASEDGGNSVLEMQELEAIVAADGLELEEADVENAAASTEEASAKILGHVDGEKAYESTKLDGGVTSNGLKLEAQEGEATDNVIDFEPEKVNSSVVELTYNNFAVSDGADFARAGDSVADTAGLNLSNVHPLDTAGTRDVDESAGVSVAVSTNMDKPADSETSGAYIDSKSASALDVVETPASSPPYEKIVAEYDGSGGAIGPETVVINGAEEGGGHAAAAGPASVDKGIHLPAGSDGSVTHGDEEMEIFGSSETAKQFLEELEGGMGNDSDMGRESSLHHADGVDGQIISDSDEEVDTDGEGDDGKELFDSDALAALLKAAANAGSDGGSVTVTSQDGSRLFSLERPAGLGSSTRSLKPAPQPIRSSLFAPSNLAEGSEDNLSEEEKNKLKKLQQIRVKFLRLVHRLGYSSEDPMVQQVLYRLTLAAGRQTSPTFNVEEAKRTALQLEAEGNEDLNFSLNILVLGKTGAGKSATINSIIGEGKAVINAFEPATSSVKEIVGTVDGVKIRVFDTPGLRSSAIEQGLNRKALSSINKCTKSTPPDIMLYVDRLDSQTRDLNDLPLLKSIASSLGSSIWRSAIVTLTHGASAPPDGPSGAPMNYDVFVAQRSHVIQQSIGQTVGDLRVVNPSLMNPVTLVENHPSCRKNREGQKVLPNGSAWKPQLLLLCYSMKILSDANSQSKSQDLFDHRKLFGFRARSPHLPYLLSWLLQSRPHPKLSADQGGESIDSEVDLDELSDSEQEGDEDEYDQLPPFKPLKKAQIAKLSREQKKAYFEEYEYRAKLLQKKQWREEVKRMREVKKGKVAGDDYMGEDFDQGNGGPAAVPVPLPDMVLPPSFDGDNPAYRYRFLEPTSQFLARPVLDTHGWDHDCGYDGVNLEQSLAIVGRFPATVAAQIAKDKNEFTVHLDSSVSAKHGENGSSMVGFDIQNVGKQLAYILKGETKLKTWRRNRMTGGMTVTFIGENVAPGIKLEDQIGLGKRLVLVGSGGAVRSQGDAAYGANLEVRLREADFPIGQDQSTLGLSLVKWRGDLALGANLLSQFAIGRGSKVAVRVALNNKMSGQVTVRTSSSEHLQIGLLGILPLALTIYKTVWPGMGENYSIY